MGVRNSAEEGDEFEGVWLEKACLMDGRWCVYGVRSMEYGGLWSSRHWKISGILGREYWPGVRDSILPVVGHFVQTTEYLTEYCRLQYLPLLRRYKYIILLEYR